MNVGYARLASTLLLSLSILGQWEKEPPSHRRNIMFFTARRKENQQITTPLGNETYAN